MSDRSVKRYTLVAACLVLFMAGVDNLVLNVALPSIGRDLQATTGELQWIVAAYTLLFASAQITAGGLGDRFGRKRFFLVGLVVFTGASAMGALSPGMGWLIAARVAQGLGAAFVFPLSLSLISAAFPPSERAKALGIWGAVSVSGVAFGPVVGGALVSYANWHWAFWINVPVGFFAFALTAVAVRESRDGSGTAPTDVFGTVLVTGAVAALAWGLIEAGDRGWTDGAILAAFGAAALLLAAFVVVESRVARPMVPLRFFRSPTFTGANVVGFALSFLIAGVAFYTTLYQQNVHGLSALEAGLALLPMVATMMVGSPLSGFLAPRVGASKLISLGMLAAGAGALLLLLTGVDAGFFAVVPGLVVIGLGMSFIFAPSMTAVLNSVEDGKSGVASAVNGAFRETGTAFGVAVLGTVMSRAYLSAFEASPEVRDLRSDPESAPLQPVLDLVGSGIGFAGRLVGDAGLRTASAGALERVRDASSAAFVSGMDSAIVVSAIAAAATAVLAYLLVDDRVAAPVPEEPRTPEEAGMVPDRAE